VCNTAIGPTPFIPAKTKALRRSSVPAVAAAVMIVRRIVRIGFLLILFFHGNRNVMIMLLRTT